MEKNNLIVCTIGIMVSVILIGGLLMPVVNDAIDDQYEYYNNSAGQYSKIVSDEVTLEFVANADENTYTYSVNGELQTTIPNYNNVLFSTSGAALKVSTVGGTYSSYLVWYAEEGGSKRINMPNSITATLTPTNMSFTVTHGGSNVESVTIPIDWGFYAVTNGDYRAVWDMYDVKINDVDQVYTSNLLSTTNKFFSAKGENVFYDGQTIEAEYDLAPVNGVVNVFELKSGDFTFTVDNNGSPYVASPYYVIVPVEIIGDKTGTSDAISGMLSTVPIIVIVSLLAAGAYFIIGRKN